MSYSNEPPSYGSPPPPPPGGGYGGPPGGPPGGGYGGYGGGQPQSQSIMAIIGLVAGIIGILSCCCFVPSVAALVLGILGKKEIAESNGTKTGAGMAQAAFILGIVGLVLGLLYWVANIIWGLSYDAAYDY